MDFAFNIYTRRRGESRMLKRLRRLVVGAIFAVAFAVVLSIIFSTLNTGRLPW